MASLQPQRAQNQRDEHTAIKILALLRKKGIRQIALADKYGVKKEAIYRAIWGVRSGKRLRSAIAYELGYKSWDELKKARVTL